MYHLRCVAKKLNEKHPTKIASGVDDMGKSRSSRNKTINISINDGISYLNRCIKVSRYIDDITSIVNKTIIGDTFEVCSCLPEESIDMIIVDPPYNLTKSYNGNVFHKMSFDEYEAYTRKWINLIYPLLKTTGSIYVCCDWESSLIIGKVLFDTFNIKSRITWQREKGRGSKSNWKNTIEDIWFVTKSNNYTFNLDSVKTRKRVIAPYRVNGVPKDWNESSDGKFRDTCPSNFWNDITIPFWSMPENTAHPTQKPEKLLAKLILASSNPGDIIFDPFLGSGTTSVVAKKLGRRYIGIEQDKQYCIWAEKRLEMADNDKSIQGYDGKVFYDRNFKR